MLYIIDDQITYNSDDCTLSHLPTQETLSLSISACRLFEQVLNSDGEILARDTLLTEVWDKYGLRGSNSNLNQYLSILRRALAAYGCENLIITVPKTGIRLNTEIKIVREPVIAIQGSDVSEDTSATVAVDLPDAAVSESTFIVPPSEKNFMKNPRVIIAAVTMLTLIGIFIYYILIASAPDNSDFSTITLEGGCEAVLFEGIDVIEHQSIGKKILQILKKNNEACTAGRRVFFDTNTASNPNNFDRTILSACNLDSQGHIISCNNFYYLDWRMH